MAKEKGKIEDCLYKTIHHFTPAHAGMITFAYETRGLACMEEILKYRFSLAEANLTPVVKKIREIRDAAKAGDCQAVLRILDEEIEFGHNF